MREPAPVVVETPATFDFIESKGYGFCGLNNGRAFCWDNESFSALDGASDWSRVSVFDWKVCGLRGSNVFCRYDSGGDLIQVGAGLSWTWVDVGVGRFCGIASGSLYCWSSGGDPMPIGTASDWESVTTGDEVVCGIRAGEIYCFGDNTYGQLGIDDLTIPSSADPLPIAMVGPWQDVRSHYSTTCALRSGEIYCWGSNNHGFAGGDPQELVVTRPTRIGSLADWTAVSVGEGHGCALRAGGVFCWGSNDSNQFGTAEPDRDPHPEPVPISLDGG